MATRLVARWGRSGPRCRAANYMYSCGSGRSYATPMSYLDRWQRPLRVRGSSPASSYGQQSQCAARYLGAPCTEYLACRWALARRGTRRAMPAIVRGSHGSILLPPMQAVTVYYVLRFAAPAGARALSMSYTYSITQRCPLCQ